MYERQPKSIRRDKSYRSDESYQSTEGFGTSRGTRSKGRSREGSLKFSKILISEEFKTEQPQSKKIEESRVILGKTAASISNPFSLSLKSNLIKKADSLKAKIAESEKRSAVSKETADALARVKERLHKGKINLKQALYFNDDRKIGASKQAVGDLEIDGKTMFFKKGPKEIYDKYKMLEELGIGVRVLTYDLEQQAIIMEKGIPLDEIEFIDIPRNADLQLEGMYRVLVEEKLAHCDIKGANIVVIQEGKIKQLKLIDADNLSKFGENRYICSPGHNITRQEYKQFRNGVKVPCNENTDFEGFKKLKEYVGLKGQQLQIIQELQKVNFIPKDLDNIDEVEDEDDSDYEGDLKFTAQKNENLFYTFITLSMEKGIDLLIILDLTGSMGPYRDMAKNTIFAAIDYIKKRYVKSTVRFGFVGFRDFDDGAKRIVQQDFTSDFQKIKDLIEAQEATGGGDECEDLIGALEVANTFKYELTNITNIFMITDAPPHGRQYYDSKIGIADNHADEIPEGTLENYMKQLSKKSEIIKFGCLKLKEKRLDKTFQIMKESFGQENFHIMSQAAMKSIKPGGNFMTDSLKIFIETSLGKSFFASSRMVSNLHKK